MVGTVRDITLALDAVVGPEPTDLRSLPMPDESWLDAVVEELHAPRRVGWSPTLGYAAVDRGGPGGLRAGDRARSRGAAPRSSMSTPCSTRTRPSRG